MKRMQLIDCTGLACLEPRPELNQKPLERDKLPNYGVRQPSKISEGTCMSSPSRMEKKIPLAVAHEFVKSIPSRIAAVIASREDLVTVKCQLVLFFFSIIGVQIVTGRSCISADIHEYQIFDTVMFDENLYKCKYARHFLFKHRKMKRCKIKGYDDFIKPFILISGLKNL